MAGLDATVSALDAAVISISVCRSCSRRATEPLFPRPSMDWKRLVAPVPWGSITLTAPQTTTTSSKARNAAGIVMPVRWKRPRFLRSLREPDEPVSAAPARVPTEPGSVPAESASEIRESPVDACGRSASISVRCRDNAVPSVHAVHMAHSSTAADQRCQKETAAAGDVTRKAEKRTYHSVTLITGL